MYRHHWFIIQEPGTFGKIIAIDERINKIRYFRGVGSAIGIKGNNNFPFSFTDTQFKGIAFTFAGLEENTDARAQFLCHRNGAVGRMPIDQQYFINPFRYERQNVREIGGFINRANYDSNAGVASWFIIRTFVHHLLTS